MSPKYVAFSWEFPTLKAMCKNTGFADALKLGCPGFWETLVGLQMVYLMVTLPGRDGELQFLILYRYL